MATAHEYPVVIGFDGSPSAERALCDTAALLEGHAALIVVVWDPNLPFELLQHSVTLAPIDVRTGLEINKVEQEQAQRLAEQGAELARERGLEAEGLAVADDITVAETLVRLARERHASAIAIGLHGHRSFRELVMGGTARDVIRSSPCLVILRGPGPKEKKKKT